MMSKPHVCLARAWIWELKQIFVCSWAMAETTESHQQQVTGESAHLAVAMAQRSMAGAEAPVTAARPTLFPTSQTAQLRTQLKNLSHRDRLVLCSERVTQTEAQSKLECSGVRPKVAGVITVEGQDQARGILHPTVMKTSQ